MIFFSATDIGGARALIPVLYQLDLMAVPFCLMDGGVLAAESDGAFSRISRDLIDDEVQFKRVLLEAGIALVCVGTAVTDRLPIYQVAWAKQCGIHTVAVLDNWMNYRQRFVLPDLGVCFPDHYFVMDEIAYNEAITDGVPSDILEITGQPALADFAKGRSRKVRSEKDPLKLIFISEPVAQDQGVSVIHSSYRGYTEFDVLDVLADFFAHKAVDVELMIVPHPREDRAALATFCSRKFPSTLNWAMSPFDNGRDAIFEADGVVGMTSILLYEAWLLGLPVISLQPGLRGCGAAHLSQRVGLIYVTELEACFDGLNSWSDCIRKSVEEPLIASRDVSLHCASSIRIAKQLENLVV